MTATAEDFWHQLPSLMLWLLVLLLIELSKANDEAGKEYSVHMTGDLIKFKGERTINISCLFQEWIPDIDSVSLQRKIDENKWEKLLEEKPNVNGGSANLVATPKGTKFVAAHGSLQERRLTLLFSNVTGDHTGLYSCNVTHKSGSSSNWVYVNANRATERNLYPIQMNYDLMTDDANTSVMEVKCHFEGIPSIDKAVMRRLTVNKLEYLMRADSSVDGGEAKLTKPDDPRLKGPQGSLAEKWFSMVVLNVTSADSGVYECYVDYNAGDGLSQQRLPIQIGPEPYIAEDMQPAPVMSSRASFVDQHGRPALIASFVLLCCKIMHCAAGDFP